MALWHNDTVEAASFSPDGRTLVTASWDETARLWDAQTGQEIHRLPHEDVVWSVSFSPDGRTALTASKDETAQAVGRRQRKIRRLTHDAKVWSASFSPDGRTVVTASSDNTARLWDAQSGKEFRRFAHETGVSRTSSTRTAAPSSPPATRRPGCGTPGAARSC